MSAMRLAKTDAETAKLLQSTTADQRRVAVAELRGRHAERAEDALLCERTQRRAGHALDDDAQQDVPGVGVAVLVARRKVERALTCDHRQEVGVRDRVVVQSGEDE